MKSGTARTALFKKTIRAHSRNSRATCKRSISAHFLTSPVKTLVPKTSFYKFAMQRPGIHAGLAKCFRCSSKTVLVFVVNDSTVVDKVLEMSLGFGTAEDDVIVAKFPEQLARHVVNRNGSLFCQDPRDLLEPRVVVVDQPIAALYQMIEGVTVPWVYHVDIRPQLNDSAKRPKILNQQSTSAHIAPTNVGRDCWQNMVTRKEMATVLQAD